MTKMASIPKRSGPSPGTKSKKRPAAVSKPAPPAKSATEPEPGAPPADLPPPPDPADDPAFLPEKNPHKPAYQRAWQDLCKTIKKNNLPPHCMTVTANLHAVLETYNQRREEFQRWYEQAYQQQRERGQKMAETLELHRRTIGELMDDRLNYPLPIASTGQGLDLTAQGRAEVGRCKTVLPDSIMPEPGGRDTHGGGGGGKSYRTWKNRGRGGNSHIYFSLNQSESAPVKSAPIAAAAAGGSRPVATAASVARSKPSGPPAKPGLATTTALPTTAAPISTPTPAAAAAAAADAAPLPSVLFDPDYLRQNRVIDTSSTHVAGGRKKKFYNGVRPDYLNILINPVTVAKVRAVRRIKPTKTKKK